MTQEAIKQILPDVRRAARFTARSWYPVIEEEDAEQEIILRIMEADYLETIVALDPAARAETLRKIGAQIASEYRNAYDHFSGNFYYSTNDVREILKRVGTNREKASSNTERLDLEEGLEVLRERNPRYENAIIRRYWHEEDIHDTKLLSRATDLLTEYMNNVHRNRGGFTEGVGTRRLISSRKAKAISRQYN